MTSSARARGSGRRGGFGRRSDAATRRRGDTAARLCSNLRRSCVTHAPTHCRVHSSRSDSSSTRQRANEITLKGPACNGVEWRVSRPPAVPSCARAATPPVQQQILGAMADDRSGRSRPRTARHRRGLSGPLPSPTPPITTDDDPFFQVDASAVSGGPDGNASGAGAGFGTAHYAKALPPLPDQRAREAAPAAAKATLSSGPPPQVGVARTPPTSSTTPPMGPLMSAPFRQLRRGRSLDNVHSIAVSAAAAAAWYQTGGAGGHEAGVPLAHLARSSLSPRPFLAESAPSLPAIMQVDHRSKPPVYLTEMVLTPPPSAAPFASSRTSSLSRSTSPSLGVAAGLPASSGSATPRGSIGFNSASEPAMAAMESTPLFRGSTLLRDSSFPGALHTQVSVGQDRRLVHSPLTLEPVAANGSAAQPERAASSLAAFPPLATAVAAPVPVEAAKARGGRRDSASGGSGPASPASERRGSAASVVPPDGGLASPVGGPTEDAASAPTTGKDVTSPTAEHAASLLRADEETVLNDGGAKDDQASAGVGSPSEADGASSTQPSGGGSGASRVAEGADAERAATEAVPVTQLPEAPGSSHSLDSLGSQAPIGRVLTLQNEAPRRRRGSVAVRASHLVATACGKRAGVPY